MTNLYPQVFNTKVKYIHSDTVGAPQLEDSWGSLQKVLKACLVDGFGEMQATVVSYDSSKKLLRIEGSGFSYPMDTVVELSGHSDSRVNKQFRVYEATGTYIHLSCEEDLSGISSGNVTIKTPSLGWSLAYDDISSSGIAVYKSANEELPAYLKVIDKLPPNGYQENWCKFVRVVGSSSLNPDGTFPGNVKFPKSPEFPDAELVGNKVQGSGGIHGWYKWYYRRIYNTESGPHHRAVGSWSIIGDDKTFYIWMHAVEDNPGITGGFGLYNDFLHGADNFLMAEDGWYRANNSAPADKIKCSSDTGGWSSGTRGLVTERDPSGIRDGFTFARIHNIAPTHENDGALHYRCLAVSNKTGEVYTEPAKLYQPTRRALRGHLRGLNILWADAQDSSRVGTHKAFRIWEGSNTSRYWVVSLDLEGWDKKYTV